MEKEIQILISLIDEELKKLISSMPFTWDFSYQDQEEFEALEILEEKYTGKCIMTLNLIHFTITVRVTNRENLPFDLSSLEGTKHILNYLPKFNLVKSIKEDKGECQALLYGKPWTYAKLISIEPDINCDYCVLVEGRFVVVSPINLRNLEKQVWKNLFYFKKVGTYQLGHKEFNSESEAIADIENTTPDDNARWIRAERVDK